MLGGAKERVIRRAIENHGVAEVLSTIIAGFETELIEEIYLLHEALGIEYLEGIPDEEQRQEALEELALSKLAGDAEGWYIEYSLAEHLDDAEDARPYLGLDEDDWQEQIETWADLYRERGAGDDQADRDLARQHVHRKFGVTLEEFEARVVGWDEGRMLERQISGNFQVAREAVRIARLAIESEGDIEAALEDEDVDVEELVEDLRDDVDDDQDG